MRIISGKYRGKKLNTIDSISTRPTTDRVKENIFNIIGPRISGSLVLDVFAGSGSMGIECASRGALKVYCNDSSSECMEVIKENISGLKDCNNIQVYCKDYMDFLGSSSFGKWDLIFLDPPYSMVETYPQILNTLVTKKMLKDNALIICEHKTGVEIPLVDGLYPYKNKKYGNVSVSIFTVES